MLHSTPSLWETTRKSSIRSIQALISLFFLATLSSPLAADVFINEIHYDNASTDAGEAIEVAGSATTDLTGWTIALYNGSNGEVYSTINLAGVIPDQDNGYGTLSFAEAGIQNGAPDGMALVDDTMTVLQFLSYEGTFTAVDGPAIGMMSTDIGVTEGSGTPLGDSLQLGGTGLTYNDFTWQTEMPNTFGAVNTGQIFDTPPPPAKELLLSEFVVTPTEGEFIEIYNPGANPIDLSDVYLTDATFAGGSTYYYNIVTGSNAGGGGFGDFHARFPDGASIGPGEYQTVAINGSDNFAATYGVVPTYELYEDGAPDSVPDMREALPGSINGQGGLTNSGEVIILYAWNGVSDLVQDLDYALWGDKDEAVDKTGVAIDGPDADMDASEYLPDTEIGSQDVIASGAHAFGNSFARIDLAEGTETQSGGNGIDGDDETSENLSVTWGEVAPVEIIITEIMQNPNAVFDSDGEWFEIHNPTESDIDINGWTIADLDSDSHVIDNGGPLLVPAEGYLVLGNNADMATNGGVNVGYQYSGIALANGGDEVVLFDGTMTEIDSVAYDGGPNFPDPTGASMSLSDLALDNNVGENWCESITIFGDGDLGTPGEANVCVVVIPPFGVCGDPATPIHDVQGDGLSSPIAGMPGIIIEGVVVGDFQGSDQLEGFFLQEEDSEADADPLTSEGIFVFDGGFGTDVSVGDVVRVQGTVTEYFDLTEINNVNNVEVCGSGGIATSATVNLPVTAVDDLEPFEGMSVHFPQTLHATDNFTLARYGEVGLSIGGVLDNPTNVVEPGAPAIALQADNNLRQIQLDDGSTVENPLPLPPYLNADGTLRVGDNVTGLMGAMAYAFGVYEVHPTAPVVFDSGNPRPLDPPDTGGSLVKVAGFNVLNYFTTLDGSGPICGPLANQDCRGADNMFEFERQRAKIVAALSTLQADVVGLIEIENAPDDTPIADLVDGINDVLGAGAYAYVSTGAVGSDAIRQGLIYRPAVVSLVGGFETLDSLDDPLFNDQFNRPTLAQTFSENTTGERFTVAVNHLKSKGSACDSLGDPDTGDGQGNCNLTRAMAATVLVDWLATDPTGSGSDRAIVIGDLNSYAMEDPIVAIQAGGFVDLIATFVGIGFADGAYSYAFDGQMGYLDHALASPGFLADTSGAAPWHINGDEPSGLDYNNYNQPGLFKPDPFRSSDHDAVIAGLLIDEDGDGVWDEVDDCPGTVIPEGVPTEYLGVNRYALVDDDGVFDTTPPRGDGPIAFFDVWDTAGCSCEQIIVAQGLGKGHTRFGCSVGEMREWVEMVKQP